MMTMLGAGKGLEAPYAGLHQSYETIPLLLQELKVNKYYNGNPQQLVELSITNRQSISQHKTRKASRPYLM